MKACELCENPARMYCDSDKASLCWACDNKVHSANFLVAKHHRNLLCRTCQSPTPWKASGSSFGPTVSVCESCFSSHCNVREQQEQESHSEEEEEEVEIDGDEEETFEDDYVDDDCSDSEDGDNQVVPWSEMAPPATICCSSEEETTSGSKRMIDLNADLDSDDEIGCSSSHQDYGRDMKNEEGTSHSSHNYISNDDNKRSKRARISEDDHEADNHGEEVSKSRSSAASIIDSLKRLQRNMVSDEQSAAADILDICKLSRDHSIKSFIDNTY